ncbi:hypothetical protein, partial [Dialister sp.]|uniref:hypothetical protein n=1 Tax=Dialister sp. TaxID=1955814 RepID=UPI002E8154C3
NIRPISHPGTLLCLTRSIRPLRFLLPIDQYVPEFWEPGSILQSFIYGRTCFRAQKAAHHNVMGGFFALYFSVGSKFNLAGSRISE